MRRLLFSLIIPLAFVIIALLTLSDYGINEDSPVHFFRGQAYLHLLSGQGETYKQPRLKSPILHIPGQRISTYKPNTSEEISAAIRPVVSPDDQTLQAVFKKYLNQSGRHSFYEHQSWNGAYFKNLEVPGHPPLSDILSAATNWLSYEKLGILGDIESYHLYIVLTAALLLLTVWVFSYKVFGLKVALFSTISLALYPIFFAESHFNIKDVPETSFFGVSIISFYFLIKSLAEKKLSKWWFLIFNLSTLLALGTKLNAVFLPVILVIWLFLVRKSTLKVSGKKVILYIGISIFLVSFLFIILWPYLWSSPFFKIAGILNFYQTLGTTDPKVQSLSPFLVPGIVNLTGLMLIVSNTPIITLILFSFGFWLLIKSTGELFKHSEIYEKEIAGYLVLIWFLVPILRVLWPHADVFGSIRQFMEFLPAFCIIAGIGAEYIIQKLKVKSQKYRLKLKSFEFLVVVLSFAFYTLSLVVPIIRYHPNENIYFNGLVGGPKGALKLGLLDWQASYDNPYRQAVNWLNQHADMGAKLAFLEGSMEAIPAIWLRDDINFGSYFSGLDQKGEYIILLVYPKPPRVFAYLYPDRFLTPVSEVKSNGVTLARVFKNDLSLMKPEFKKFEKIDPIPTQTTGQDNLGDFWQINFDKPIKLISLEVKKAGDCDQKDGLFKLNTYLVPQRVDQANSISNFYFPAEETSVVRFYGLSPDSCLLKGQVKEIKAFPTPK